MDTSLYIYSEYRIVVTVFLSHFQYKINLGKVDISLLWTLFEGPKGVHHIEILQLYYEKINENTENGYHQYSVRLCKVAISI